MKASSVAMSTITSSMDEQMSCCPSKDDDTEPVVGCELITHGRPVGDLGNAISSDDDCADDQPADHAGAHAANFRTEKNPLVKFCVAVAAAETMVRSSVWLAVKSSPVRAASNGGGCDTCDVVPVTPTRN